MTRAGSASPRSGFETLRARGDFQRVLRDGVRRRMGGLVVVGVRAPASRVGIVVGRRLGNAVVRNRIKRRLRAAIQQVGLPAGWDIVMLPAPSVATVTFSRLVQWTEQALDGLTDMENNGKR